MMRRILILLFAAVVASGIDASAFDKTGRKGHFAWGAELGPAIDLCGDDMSTIDVGGFFGWRNDFVDFLGVGAGINMVMSHSGRFYPVYAGFRSSFSQKKKLVFLDARVGCVFGTAFDGPSQTAFYVSPGLGFNLASGAKYQSYILINYSYCGMNFPAMKAGNEVTGVNRVGLTIGVTF